MENTAIILAGGKSSRMGRNKPLAMIGGERLIERAARTVSSLFDSLIVVTNSDLGVEIRGVYFVRDIVPFQGPLGGLQAGLAASDTEDNFVLACDMPFVTRELIEYIWSLRREADAVLPKTEKGIEPLCAAYSKSCLPAVNKAMKEGTRRIITVIESVSTRIVGPNELAKIPGIDRAFLNINTETDLQEALKMSGGQPWLTR